MHILAAPSLENDRVKLRAYLRSDFEPFAALFGSERSRYIDGPVPRAVAWDLFAAGAGRWQLVGYGAWAIECKSTGQPAGFVSLNYPILDDARELGYGLFAGFEGRGLAIAATRLARDFAYESLGWQDMVSCISKDNHRSVHLVEKLGAFLDHERTEESGEVTLVFRHVRTS